MDVDAGRRRRLIISLPPRHGKSRASAVELPTWMLGKDPTKEIVLVSYSADLATFHSKQARERMQDPLYREIFPGAELNPLDISSDDWATAAGGRYKAVGIGGSLTGRGADCIILDDFHKDYEEAHSPSQREKVWNWFRSVAYTRLTPNGAIIIIGTRWNVDDLSGRLIDPVRREELEEAGMGTDESFEVVNLPALAKDNDPMGRAPGAALFPERYPAERLRNTMLQLGSYLSSALYDGNPVAKGGNYVDAEKFKIITREAVPSQLHWRRFWDLATSSKATSDYTAGIKGALGPPPGSPDAKPDCLYLADLIKGQWEWPKARERIKSTAIVEQIPVGIETVAGFKTGYANLREGWPADIPLRDYGEDRDKLSRALGWFAMADAGKVYLVRGDWVHGFKQEVEAFPSGKFLDQVDAVSGVYTMLKQSRFTLLIA